MENRRCIQTKCDFLINGGCKSCDSCNAEPNMINITCQRCIKCEGICDELRFENIKEVMKMNKEIKIDKEARKQYAEFINCECKDFEKRVKGFRPLWEE